MAKELLARALARRVKDGEVIGLGSGSTAELAVEKIGERVRKEKLRLRGVPTSHRIALCAQEAGIEVLSMLTPCDLDWAFDGADEVDGSFHMIKGRGGAMLNEKIVATRAKDKLVIIVSEEKIVERLGEKFPVPVEVVPEALDIARKELQLLGANEIKLREGSAKYGPTITEHNNFILDAKFANIVPELETKIKSITGVVESGLFIGATKELLVSLPSGVFTWELKAGSLVKTPINDA